MTSLLPPRDWTDIHWPEIARRRCGALDRGVAAGGDRAAWPAFACRDRRHDRRGLSGAGPRTAAAGNSRDISADTADRDFHRTHPLSRHADAADRGGAQGLDGARRERRARRRQKTGDGHEPWRQQCRDEPCRAGSARASRASRGHHGLVALRHAGRIILGGRIAPRHPWRRGRNLDHAGALSAACSPTERSPISGPAASRWKSNIAGFRRIGRRRSRGRPRTFIPAAPPATPHWPRRKKANACSITARMLSASCLPMSTSSIRRRFPMPRRATILLTNLQ